MAALQAYKAPARGCCSVSGALAPSVVGLGLLPVTQPQACPARGWGGVRWRGRQPGAGGAGGGATGKGVVCFPMLNRSGRVPSRCG